MRGRRRSPRGWWSGRRQIRRGITLALHGNDDPVCLRQPETRAERDEVFGGSGRIELTEWTVVFVVENAAEGGDAERREEPVTGVYMEEIGLDLRQDAERRGGRAVVVRLTAEHAVVIERRQRRDAVRADD